MSKIQQILHGITVALSEDGPAAVRIEIDTALKAMDASTSEYFHEDVAMAVFGHRDEEPEDAQ